MTVIVESIYENVDQEWIDWWLKHLHDEEVMPGSTVIVQKLKESGHAVFTSKDPTGPVIATTSYTIKQDDDPTPIDHRTGAGC